MGNRVWLELHGDDPAGEPLLGLACNNGLPLFWLALLREEDLGGAWQDTVHAAFADPDGPGVAPLRLAWRAAGANLAAARAAARLPAWAPLLQRWETALAVPAAREVRLSLAEHAQFFDDAETFLEALRRDVRFWHGAPAPAPRPVTDPAFELTGFDARTDRPFPETEAIAPPGRAAPVPRRAAGEWGMVALFLAMVSGAAWLGARWLEAPWLGGGLGAAAAVVVIWRWAAAR